jgi:hypothetical protein
MKRVLLLATLTACPTSSGDDFPVEPGGPGPGGIGMMRDAALVDAFDPDAMQTIAGRVCLVTDLRALSTCAPIGAGNITVTLGTRSATTSDSGAFTIVKPAGTNLVWRASGAGIVSSVVPFGPSTLIPAIGDVDYIDLQNANGVVVIGGEGSIVARIVRNTTAQANVVVGVSPVAAYAPKYDGPTALAWREISTGAAGVAWIAGTELGTNVLTATPGPGPLSVLVEDQAITYVTVELP